MTWSASTSRAWKVRRWGLSAIGQSFKPVPEMSVLKAVRFTVREENSHGLSFFPELQVKIAQNTKGKKRRGKGGGRE